MIAGWITMMSAFMALPQTYLVFRLGSAEDSRSIIIQMVVQLFGIILFSVITLCLKRLLNTRFRFHATDRQIELMIMANVTAGILVLVGMNLVQYKETLGIAAMVILVFQGIVQIQFGYRLLKLGDDLAGMLKPFCYANMATGICIASLLLMLVGVVVSAISDLMLATIFFNIAKLTRATDTSNAEDQ